MMQTICLCQVSNLQLQEVQSTKTWFQAQQKMGRYHFGEPDIKLDQQQPTKNYLKFPTPENLRSDI